MDNSTPAHTKGSSTGQPFFLTRLWDARTARVLSTALIFFLVLGFLYKAHDTLILFLFAILFAYFLAPLLNRLQAPLHGRGRSVAAVYVVLGLLLSALGFAVGPTIAQESKQLVTSLPSLLDRLGSGELVSQFGQAHRWTGDRINQVQDFLVHHRADILGYGRVLFLGVWRLVQDYISAPRIMGKSLEIDPLTQIFAVLAGGEIAGVVGALVSVPVVALLRIVWRRIRDGREATATLPAQADTGV